MTRAACNLILNITKICLTYRSIKALKRSGKNDENDDDDYNNHNNNESKHIHTKDKIQEIQTNENDLEILQLWSLIAFLTIYNGIGIETILSIFPLYYYFKMILILITAIPSTKFPNFWCEVLLIPMMQKCHELIDLDWKYILIRELIMLPWRILDVTIMPGLLCDEKTIEEVKKKRMVQIQNASYCNLQEVFRNTLLYNNKKDDDTHITDDMILKHEIVNLQSDLSNNSNINDDNNNNNDDDTIVSIQTNVPTTGIMSPSSPIARSRVAASSLHLRKFSRDHQQHHHQQHHHQHSNQQQTTINSTSNDNDNITCDDESSDNNTEDKYIIEFDENDNIEIHHPSKRTSLNQRLRSFITGDSNIRLRDYLFDVDLPSAPSRDSNLISPSKTFESDYDCDGVGGGRRRDSQRKMRYEKIGCNVDSNVTIRRNRRLANQRI